MYFALYFVSFAVIILFLKNSLNWIRISILLTLHINLYTFSMTSEKIASLRQEIETYLTNGLLPFWIARTVDKENGGFLTHFDQFGNDSGEDEKSLIAQSRSVFTYSSVHRAGSAAEICSRRVSS